MATCTKCKEILVNGNCITCSSCIDEECCLEIVKTTCIKHGEDTFSTVLDDILTEENAVFNTQPIGGTAIQTRNEAINQIVSFLSTFQTTTFDLSGIDLAGSPGPGAANWQTAIQFLIDKVDEEHV